MNNPRTTPAPRPGPRKWAAPLFALGMAMFWLGLNLPGMLLDKQQRQTLHWPPGAAESVRRVIIEAPLGNTWDSVDLRWYHGPPRLDVLYGSPQSPPLQLVHEGDTLYVRQPPPPADAGRDKTRIDEIWLPMQVEMVQGRNLSVRQERILFQTGQAAFPPRLELRAQKVHVYKCCGSANAADGPGSAGIGDLHVIGLAPPKNEADRCRPLDDIEIKIDAQKIARLHIETLGGKLELENIRLGATQLRTPPGVSMHLDDISRLPELHWRPLPPDRASQISQMLPADHLTRQQAYCNYALHQKR